MEVKVTEAKIESKDVSAIAVFTATLDEIAALAEEDKYGARKRIANAICDQIAGKLADEYLKEHKAEIMDSIHIDKIIHGIQLKVVEGFSLQQR